MSDIATTTPLSASAAPDGKPGVVRNRRHLLLLAPGVLWLLLFLVLPLLMVVYVSFWTQTTFAVSPDLTIKSWVTFFSSDTYFGALIRTLRIWLIVLALTLAIGYPTALFIGQFLDFAIGQTNGNLAMRKMDALFFKQGADVFIDLFANQPLIPRLGHELYPDNHCAVLHLNDAL